MGLSTSDLEKKKRKPKKKARGPKPTKLRNAPDVHSSNKVGNMNQIMVDDKDLHLQHLMLNAWEDEGGRTAPEPNQGVVQHERHL